MSTFIKNFAKKNRPQFKKYKKYIKDNDWTKEIIEKDKEGNITFIKYYNIKDTKVRGETIYQGKESEYKVHDKMSKVILSKLKHFYSNAEAEIKKQDKKATDLVDEMVGILNLHLKRVNDHISNGGFSEEEKQKVEEEKTKSDKEYQLEEIEFDNQLYKDEASISGDIRKLNLDEKEDLTTLYLLDNAKAPLSMREKIEEEFPEIKDKVEAMGLDFTSSPKNEMLIHIENPPEWDPNKHYFEQDRDTLQFYIDEYKKIKDGIVIDGQYITPWLYCHLNIFKTPIPTPTVNKHTGDIDINDEIGHPPLRDNEWFMIQESYYKAKKEGKVLFYCATRRAAKTTDIASLCQYTVLSGGKELLIAGGSQKDLGQIEKNFQITASNAHPAFKTPNITNDWSKKVRLGVKKKSQQNILLSTLHIVNLNKGGEKSSEILAGYTPDLFVLDECMKAPFLDQFRAAKPAFQSNYGSRLVPLLSGCVCAGTKVWDNQGNLVNIEDLKPENGILGYDIENKKVSQENITYWQPPHEKECYRITTNKGRTLECSDDHPIFTKEENDFVETKDLRVGSQIATVTEEDKDTIVYEEIVKTERIGKKPVYNLTAGNTHTYIANGIVTHNTGSGNDALTKDAMMLLANPDIEDVLHMDWDKLEENIPVNEITWKRRKFATFIPGQMSMKEGMMKIEQTLTQYLRKEGECTNLDKIKILVTDWKNNNKVIREDRKKLSSDTKALLKEKVYFPIDPEEIFLSGKTNPFPKEEIRRWKEKLIEEGDIGKKVVLDYNEAGDVVYELSNKEYPPLPFNGGFFDAPVTIFEDPLPNATFELTVSGLDDYKQEESDGDSIGSFVLVRRDTGNVVATYHSRPDPHGFFHRQGMLLLEFYKAPVFMENADMGFKEYTDRLGVTDEYLIGSLNFLGNIQLDNNGRRAYGWTPTPKNKSFLFGLFLNVMKETVVIEDPITGKKTTKWGFQKVKDIRMLDEMINYQDGNNVDTISAALGAYGYDYYLTANHISPRLPMSDEEKEYLRKKKEEQKKNKKTSSIFSSTRRRRSPW